MGIRIFAILEILLSLEKKSFPYEEKNFTCRPVGGGDDFL